MSNRVQIIFCLSILNKYNGAYRGSQQGGFMAQVDRKITDWHRAWQGDQKHLPGSQGQAIRLLQNFFLPLQALVSVVSGKLAGDLEALQHCLTAEKITCEMCAGTINRTGAGHLNDCVIFTRAQEILDSKIKPAQRALESQQQILKAKLEATEASLEALARSERE